MGFPALCLHAVDAEEPLAQLDSFHVGVYGVSNIGGFSAGAQHNEHSTLGYATGGPCLESTRLRSLYSALLLIAGKVAPWECKLET